VFCGAIRRRYTSDTWTEDTATQGSDQSAGQQPEKRGGFGYPVWRFDGPEMSFPTKLKVKISSSSLVPVGAELISSELADVPQAQSIEIRFHGKYERMETRGKPYSIFTVSYSGTQSYEPGWKSRFVPFHVALKHAVKETLTSEFFPTYPKVVAGPRRSRQQTWLRCGGCGSG